MTRRHSDRRRLVGRRRIGHDWWCGASQAGFVLLSVALALFDAEPAIAADPVAVLAAAKTATGGGAWDQIRALHIHSTASAGSRVGSVDQIEDIRTGRFLTRSEYPASVSIDGFDGISVWTQGRSGIAYVLGDDDARLGAANESYRVARGWWFRDRRPATMEDAGSVREADHEYDRVRLTPAGGRPFTLWIDKSTHLIDRYVERAAEGEQEVHFSDYRRVGLVLFPFRIESDGETSVADRVEIDPAIADDKYSLPPMVTEPLADEPTVVQFRLENGKLLIPVVVDGQGPLDCEFDSGGGLILPPALVKRLALEQQDTVRAYGGGEGFVVAGRGRVGSLRIGSIELKDRAFASFAFDRDHPERLLAGQEVLQRFVVRLDFDAMTMTLTPLSQFRPDPHSRGTVVPFHFQSNQPEIYGAVDGIAGAFTIDTGDAGSLLLTAPFAERYGLAAKYHATLPYAGAAVSATRGLYTRAGRVTFNGYDGRPSIEVTRPVTRISTQETGFDANLYVSANIGIGILKQFNVTFDYGRHELTFEKSRFFGQPDIFNRTGMVLARSAAGWEVKTVYEGGPAARGGVGVGDLIMRIDNRTPAELDAEAERLAVRGAVGSKLRLEIRRENRVRILSVTLRDLL